MPSAASLALTDEDLIELEAFDHKHQKLPTTWKLYFDEDRNIIAQNIQQT